MGGAVEVHGETWDPTAGTLSATVDTVPGVSITVYAAAAGRPLLDATAEGGADLAPSEADGLALFTFVPATASTALTLTFGAEP